MEYLITHHITCPKHPQYVPTKEDEEALKKELMWNPDYKPDCTCDTYKVQVPIPLPDKISDLIELAIKDLEYVESKPDIYVVDMGVWHTPNSHCKVCLAGSVMAGTLKTDPTLRITTYSFDLDTSEKLEMLDNLRCGYVTTVWRDRIGTRPPQELSQYIRVPDYDLDFESPKRFKDKMREIATLFRKYGQ